MPKLTAADYEAARALLRRYWRHADFRPGQWEAIRAVLTGQDVLAIFPTGGGKSVCYQLPALLLEGMALVVSPLIALMEDQVARLRARGIPAAFVHSALAPSAIEQHWINAAHGAYRLLYLTPEQLTTHRFAALSPRLRISLLAVDEAHCVSDWGLAFRPAYLELSQVRAQLGHPPMLALTATATPSMRVDIVQKLGLRTPCVIAVGFDRPNLVWSVFETSHKAERVEAVVRTIAGAGILYCATRRSAERWAQQLARWRIPAVCYHSGLTMAERRTAHQVWLEDRARVMVATRAFGLGVDRADARFVVHTALPPSLEVYYQEAGRAGRDGHKAHAVLLFEAADIALAQALLQQTYPSTETVSRIYEVACSLAQVAIGSRPQHPIALDIARIAQLVGTSPSAVRRALELLMRQGLWEPVALRAQDVLLRFCTPAATLRRFAHQNPNARLGHFVETLLRSIPAEAFHTWWPVSLRYLERQTGLPRERLLRGLDFLRERALLGWLSAAQGQLVRFKEARAARLTFDDRLLRQAQQQAETQLEDMIRYARTPGCRRHFLRTYFGEAAPTYCHGCDHCLGGQPF